MPPRTTVSAMCARTPRPSCMSLGSTGPLRFVTVLALFVLAPSGECRTVALAPEAITRSRLAQRLAVRIIHGG